MIMTRKDLLNLIDKEVTASMHEPLTEPGPPEMTAEEIKAHYEPVLKSEDEIDEIMFKRD